MSNRFFAQVAGTGPQPRTYNLNITQSLLQINVIESYDDIETIVADYQLSLDTLKQAPNLKSNSLICIIKPNSTTDNEVNINNLINISSITKEQRLNNSYSYNLPLKDYGYVAIFVKDPDGTFNDHDIIVYASQNDTLENLTSNQQFELIQTFNHLDLLDNITVSEDTSYSNDDYYKFNVSTESYVSEVFLEQVIGITDRSRVKLTSGEGSFRVLKSSVESGDQLRVKVGFASYTGLANATKTV